MISAPDIRHATTVAVDQRGIFIFGSSGSGKSSLALELMSRGAVLVSDDQTELYLENGAAVARPPTALLGKIEVRGLGILAAPADAPKQLYLAIDMDQTETQRLPERRTLTLDLPGGSAEVTLLYKVDTPHFPAAVLHYMAYGYAQEVTW